MARSLPDFIVIGRMKAGTTTLSRWLAGQPDVFLSRVDEPGFFDLDPNWGRGLDWYRSLFSGASDGQMLGESSPGYTHPHRGRAAAERMAGVAPDVRLIYLLRHPIERIRSEYRHRRMLGDEDRSLIASLRDPGWHYLRQSMYHACLEPYIDNFPRDRIHVVRLEDLVEGGEAWSDVLRHIGLPPRPAPLTAHNVSAEHGMYRGAMRLRRNVELRRRLAWLPGPVRRLSNRLLRRRGPAFAAMLEESSLPIPPELVEAVWEDVGRLEDWLGRGPLWPRP